MVAALLEDYALLGDRETAALVSRDGSIDWLCFPRFDSGACFASLVGSAANGRWCIRPVGDFTVRRRYRSGTLVLETEFRTAGGVARLVDFMPPRGNRPDVVRIVEGVSGAVEFELAYNPRFDYGSIVPWMRREGRVLWAIGGPDALRLEAGVELRPRELVHKAEFRVEEGESVPFVLTWFPSHEPPPERVDPFKALDETEEWWQEWSGRCSYAGPWEESFRTSLLVLKALTYGPTGGIVAAPTTSLPEKLGGVRNWDYRYCWIRDATFTLDALMDGGYMEEARAWRDWLLRAVAGAPGEMQILYGAAGERRLPELELEWLDGYEGSRPVRIGNAAVNQFQLDVYGELMDAMHEARAHGLETDKNAWALQRALMEYLEDHWRDPDEGIWEVRGPRRHFTHSKVMAWVAADRAVAAVEHSGLDGPVDRWRRLRSEIHREVCEQGYDAERNTFTQFYGSSGLDAALLLIPLVGFLPFADPRVRGTVERVQAELCRDGFLLRYEQEQSEHVDGLPAGEGAFLPCSFWLVDCLALLGRRHEARELFERLLDLQNDVGLLAEGYDPEAGRLVGNFPQAFTHESLVGSVLTLSPERTGFVEQRSQSGKGGAGERAR
ncbi:MAG: glycoside hydrolase family 15 protein [Thermoleophilia bacterium]